jgi:rsbT co-antagonist protein RsbR
LGVLSGRLRPGACALSAQRIFMSQADKSPFALILEKYEAALLESWLKEQQIATTRRKDLIRDAELREQSRQFLHELKKAALSPSSGDDIRRQEWTGVRELLNEISRSRARQGFSPSETATFVFSFKQPLFVQMRQELATNPEALAEGLWLSTLIIDKLGLYTIEVFQKSREEIILRQQEEMLELSTPVVQLWEGILVLPLIGTLDSKRTQSVMEALLQRIVETESEIAIIDITGVPTVDTLTAQHLLKTITATRLMGAECIISGIRPQIAQTIVHLGVDLGDVITKASMASALMMAFQKLRLTIVSSKGQGGESLMGGR